MLHLYTKKACMFNSHICVLSRTSFGVQCQQKSTMLGFVSTLTNTDILTFTYISQYSVDLCTFV